MGWVPARVFLQWLVPAYERHRHRYHIFTSSLPNQILYSDLLISKSSSLPNIFPAMHAHRRHTYLVPYHQLAPFLYQNKSGKGSCWSRTWLHMNASTDGVSFPNLAYEAHSLRQMDRKSLCMGLHFNLSAGLSKKPLSTPSRLTPQSWARQE